MPFDVETAKKFFFTSDAVLRALDKGTRRQLSKFGAFVRTRARSSIRKAPKIDVATGQVTRKRKGVELKDAVSKPGNPPFSHQGTVRKLLFFAYDPTAKSVVIGPVVGGPATGAPKRLEEGGTGVTGKGAPGGPGRTA